VIKKHFVKHLIKNILINRGQHGFVPGKSMQTQLLTHFETIYETLLANERIDIVYLEFAKAFDKVNHTKLIAKVMKQTIRGLVRRWMKELITCRTQIEVANGNKSEESEVLSGSTPRNCTSSNTVYNNGT